MPVEEGLAACISRRLGEKDVNSRNKAMPGKVDVQSVRQSLTTGDRQGIEKGEPEARSQLGIRPESLRRTEAVLCPPGLYPILK